jgi:glucosamine--fructose-6-phosphate aminotransferase (isomerizing)
MTADKPNKLHENNKKVDRNIMRGKFTREEILSQPDAWSDAIEILKLQTGMIQAILPAGGFEQVIFTGCGSTHYLSNAAVSVFQELTGRSADSMPSSELWLSPSSNCVKNSDTLLVAVSRSGETSETLRACERFRGDCKGKIVTLVCNPNAPLSELGDLNLVFPSSMEKSVAQTKAFSTLYLATIVTCAIWAGITNIYDLLSPLPGLGKHLIENFYSKASEYGNHLRFDRIYFLGSAGRFGLARELSLKMKEMTLTHSEAFHFLEFRHGPKAMVTPSTLVVGLLSETNAEHEQSVFEDIENLGGEVIGIGENNADINFNSGMEEVYRNILYLPFGQMLAYERSMAKGLDPDRPNNLDAVVKLANL